MGSFLFWGLGRTVDCLAAAGLGARNAEERTLSRARPFGDRPAGGVEVRGNSESSAEDVSLERVANAPTAARAPIHLYSQKPTPRSTAET